MSKHVKLTLLTGSHVGDPSLIEEMLELAAKSGVKTWVEPFPMHKVNEAVVKFEEKGMRYRAVLFNEKNIAEINKQKQ